VAAPAALYQALATPQSQNGFARNDDAHCLSKTCFCMPSMPSCTHQDRTGAARPAAPFWHGIERFFTARLPLIWNEHRTTGMALDVDGRLQR